MTQTPLTLLHCADLHLDAVLGDSVRDSASVELTSQERLLLRDAPLLSLDHICSQAIENNVDCVIIAGDIFDRKDSATKDQRVRSRFTAFLAQLDEHHIDVAIALGNHDPLKSIQKLIHAWPKNVHLFPSKQPETFMLEKNGMQVALHGVSYETNDEARNLSSLFPSRVEGAFNIGVLHTNVGGDNQHKNYAPSTVESLTARHYDYFALGHVHTRGVVSASPHVAYSGNAQGLSAKPSEQEPKGCVLVRIDSPGGQVDTTFIETDFVRYISCSIRAEEFLESDDIVTFATQEIATACNDSDIFYLVRATIDVFGGINTDEITSALNDVRTNYFVTSLKMAHSYRSFEELVDQDPFYESIHDELNKFHVPSLEELYGTKATKISHYLAEEKAEPDVRDDAARVVLTTLSDLEHSRA